VSHVTPFGSVTGTLVNVNAMESAGIPAATTTEAVALTSLVSTLALIALFGAGLIATAGHVAPVYLLRGFCFASADLLFDLLSLGLMFGALGSRPGFGPLAVAYLRLRLFTRKHPATGSVAAGGPA
jgi:hypothetical protein